jgi:hypothetical protein
LENRVASSLVDRLGGYRSSLAFKAPCYVATTANITLSGFQTIDGVTLTALDANPRVLVHHQTDARENGIYIASSGLWQRASDFNGNNDFICGTRVYVHSGTTSVGAYVVTSEDPMVVGDDDIVFTPATAVDINFGSLATLALLDDEADFVSVFDTSASLNKKVLGRNLGFTQGGTGATLRSLQSKLRDAVTPYDFGATGDGVADDTAELQAAVTHCVASGKALFLYGSFKISSQINITGAINIEGSGWRSAEIFMETTTQHGLYVDTTNFEGVTFSGFQIRGQASGGVSTHTAGAAIYLTSTTNPAFYSTVRDLRIINPYIGIEFARTQVWTVDNCWILGVANDGIGIKVENTYAAGNGEYQISNTLIQGSVTSAYAGGDPNATGVGILHGSGVNLKIVNCEIFYQNEGYKAAPSANHGYAGTFIANTVFSQCNYPIVFDQNGMTTASFTIATITNNEIIGQDCITTKGTTQWVNNLVIANNYIGPGFDADDVAQTGFTGLRLGQVKNFTVSGNVFRGAGTGNSAWQIASTADNGDIEVNTVDPLLDVASANASTTTYVANYSQSLNSMLVGSPHIFESSGASRFVNALDSAIVQVLRLDGRRATPANNDVSYLSLFMRNDAAAAKEYGRISWRVLDVASGTEDGELDFGVIVAGTVTNKLSLNSTALFPSTNDGLTLGIAGTAFADLYLATGAVIDVGNGNYTLTHSTGLLTANGSVAATSFVPSGSTVPTNGLYLPAANTLGFAVNSTGEVQLTATALSPVTSDGNALGTTSLMWSDLFLASGAVIDFNNGDVAITHAANNLLFSGASSGYTFDAKIYPTADDGAALGDATHNFSDIFLATGSVINWANSNVTLTHASASMTFTGGNLTVARPQNGTSLLSISNIDTGASAIAALRAISDAGNAQLSMVSTAAGGHAQFSTAAAGGLYVDASHASGGAVRFRTGSGFAQAIEADVNQNVVIGPLSALATNATNGFLYIPTCAGTPTGVPTAKTGKVAIVFDTTNNQLHVYDGGWIEVLLS